jgi:hypothetical protein
VKKDKIHGDNPSAVSHFWAHVLVIFLLCMAGNYEVKRGRKLKGK